MGDFFVVDLDDECVVVGDGVLQCSDLFGDVCFQFEGCVEEVGWDCWGCCFVEVVVQESFWCLRVDWGEFFVFCVE